MNDPKASAELRERILKSKSKDIFDPETTLEPIPPDAVWATIMETTYPDATVTVVALLDGSTSMYFSNGGAIIGAGEHEHVANLTAALVKFGEFFFPPYAQPTKTFPLPKLEHVHFYFVSDMGVSKTPEYKEADLGEDQLPLSPLFHPFHALISEIEAVSGE